MRFAGSDWVKESLKKELSPIGVKAADILGEAFQGIYHLSMKSLNKVDWEDKHYIEINIYGGLSTFDSSVLTNLVFLAHWFCVRFEIEAASYRSLKLSFTDRKRGGELYNRHPTLESAVEVFKHNMIDDAEIEEYQDEE